MSGEIKAWIVVLLMSLILISSCSRYDQGISSSDNTLIIPVFQEPTIINPILTYSTISAQLVEVIFDGLVRLDESQDVIPHLARSWEISGDRLRYRFNLRKGVMFHDGVELTAEDVRFTIEKIMEHNRPNRYYYSLMNVDKVVVRDRYTIDITLARPVSSFLSGLDFGIIPMHLLENEEISVSDFNHIPIGTGPFRLTSFTRSKIVLEANKDYFLDRPYLERIVVDIYPDQKSAWSGLMGGRGDFLQLIIPRYYDILEGIGSFNLYSFLKPYYYILAFNLKNRYLRDRAVRRALNYAIDRDAIIKGVLKGRGRVSTGSIYPLSWAYNHDTTPYPYNPKKALRLLEEAGWQDSNEDHILQKDGERFRFTIYTNRGDNLKEEVLLYIYNYLIDIGIETDIIEVSSPEVLINKGFDAVLLDILALGDPDLNYNFWHSSQINNGLNHFSYKNREVDSLLDEARISMDKERRRDLYIEFQRELYDDPPGIFLFWSEHLFAINKRFKGAQPDATGSLRFLTKLYLSREE